jgi:hypothetical protein
MTTLIELCAGSAALTWGLCEQPKLLGFMGSKDRYVSQIVDIWGLPEITNFVLNDPGFWGVIWEAYCQGLFGAIADQIESWDYCESRDLFHFCGRHKDESDLIFRASTRLCLLASTYGGGETGGYKGKHIHCESVDGFIPSRKSLIKRIRQFDNLSNFNNIISSSVCATKIIPKPGCWVYIDPPYSGSLGQYETKLSKFQVILLAKKWKRQGSAVAVSESIPLDRALGEGWESRELMTEKGQYRKNANGLREYLTYCHLGEQNNESCPPDISGILGRCES